MKNIIQHIQEQWRHLSPAERIASLSLDHKTVFSTSFGEEDQILTHIIAQNAPHIDFFSLDTGRLFSETYALWAQTEKKYSISIKGYYPEPEDLAQYQKEYGVNGFYNSLEARKACCNIRKVVPLLKAIKNYDLWISGLRRAQSENRHDLPFAERDASNNIIKLYPLADMTNDAMLDFIDTQQIDINPLHHKGFLSIGCAPCTRAIKPGEHARAGRWWWEQSAQECGLHFVRGKMVKSKDLE